MVGRADGEETEGGDAVDGAGQRGAGAFELHRGDHECHDGKRRYPGRVLVDHTAQARLEIQVHHRGELGRHEPTVP